MGLGHLWAVLETLRDFGDPITATTMQKGLAAQLGPALCPTAARGGWEA